MQGSEPRPLPERSEPTPVPDSKREAQDPPTVRSGGSSLRETGHATGTLPLPLPGARIDGFVLEEAIGIGGMGAVFRALDAKLERGVALKILPPEPAQHADVIQRFYQEGRSTARRDNENIARVYAIGQGGGYHYIAFE